MNKKDKETLLPKVIDNKVRKLKSATCCFVCQMIGIDDDSEIIEIGEEVVNISGTRARVAHARHFKLVTIVAGIK